MFVVVKPFDFSLDGFTSVSFVEGDRREDFGKHTDGLKAEGYILAEATAVVVAPVVNTAPEPSVIEMAIAAEPPIETKPARRTRK